MTTQIPVHTFGAYDPAHDPLLAELQKPYFPRKPPLVIELAPLDFVFHDDPEYQAHLRKCERASNFLGAVGFLVCLGLALVLWNLDLPLQAAPV